MHRNTLRYKSSTIYDNRHFHIDESCAEELLKFLEDPKMLVKFDYIIGRILSNNFMYYADYVKLEDGLSEMRIFPNGANARIYCKEVSTINGIFFVIAAKVLIKKKSRDINKKIKQFLEPIKSYNYDL